MVRLILAGVITVDQNLMFAKYTHQMSARKEFTLFDELLFESKVFEFKKLDNGLLKVLNKDEMGKKLNGKSPDVFDNFVVLVGTRIYDIYRMLSNINQYKNNLVKNNSSYIPTIQLNRSSNDEPTDNSIKERLKLKQVSASSFFKNKIFR